MASIKDVAKKAGVGIATVSRVINDSGYVKKETREKIERVIKEINYVPNEIARSMTKQKNNIVAFIVPNSKHLFFGELIYYVEMELFNYGYKLMVCNSEEQVEKEIAYLEMLKNNRVDACIILTNNNIEDYFVEGLPLISFDRHFEGFPFIASDNYKGGELAASHLIKQGCKKIMFVGDDAQGEDIEIVSEVAKRRDGFLHYASEFKDVTTLLLEYPLDGYMNIPNYIRERIGEHPEIDGIFCVSDAVAANVILELERLGRNVPNDVKVIGFDGGRSFINLGKSMTSIGQNPEEIAKAIGEMIETYYKKEKVENRIIPIYFQNGETA